MLLANIKNANIATNIQRSAAAVMFVEITSLIAVKPVGHLSPKIRYQKVKLHKKCQKNNLVVIFYITHFMH